LGLSQAQTAAQAGLNSSEVTKIENDEAGKDARGWAKLAAFYGITLE
jgi:transcriptional regulator with XRE-family HTH domain